MTISNRYTRLVGIEHPVLQDGLGLAPTAKLAAAVSRAGGLGTVSIPGTIQDLALSAKQFREQIDECASLTDKPFAVNMPVGLDSDGNLLSFTEVLLDVVFEARRTDPQLQDQIRVLTTAASGPRNFSARIRDQGLIHQHKVGTTQHAVKAVEAGVDVVVALGSEGGAHISAGDVHTFVLGPNIRDAVDVPVILSGGIRDGRGLAAALCRGADGVGMGTRFAVSEDNSDWHAGYAAALIAMEEGGDVAFAGNYGNCRGLRNRAALSLAPGVEPIHADRGTIYDKLESMRRGQENGSTEGDLVLAGQVASGITARIRVSEFVPQMVADAERILAGLRGEA